MSKLSKIFKMPKFSKITKISNHSFSIIFFTFLLVGPYVTVPVVLWAEACPFASSSTVSLSTTGLNILCVQKILTFSLNGGRVSKCVLWGRMVLGVMPPVHVQGPVRPDHVVASAWLPVSWHCRFGCPTV